MKSITLRELQRALEKSTGQSVKIKEFRHAPAAGGGVIKGKELEKLMEEQENVK